MSYRATQIYLEPGQHGALKDEARRRGVSMAEVVRRIVAEHLEAGRATDLGSLVSLEKGGPRTDIAREKRQLLARAVARRGGLR